MENLFQMFNFMDPKHFLHTDFNGNWDFNQRLL